MCYSRQIRVFAYDNNRGSSLIGGGGCFQFGLGLVELMGQEIDILLI